MKRHVGDSDRLIIDAPGASTGAATRTRAGAAAGADLGERGPAGEAGRAARLRDLLDAPEQNEAKVEGSLAAPPGFRAVLVGEVATQVAESAHPEFLTPARHETNRVFTAMMEREAVAARPFRMPRCAVYKPITIP